MKATDVVIIAGIVLTLAAISVFATYVFDHRTDKILTELYFTEKPLEQYTQGDEVSFSFVMHNKGTGTQVYDFEVYEDGLMVVMGQQVLQADQWIEQPIFYQSQTSNEDFVKLSVEVTDQYDNVQEVHVWSTFLP